MVNYATALESLNKQKKQLIEQLLRVHGAIEALAQLKTQQDAEGDKVTPAEDFEGKEPLK